MKKLILFVLAILLLFAMPVFADETGQVKNVMDLLNLDWTLFLQLSAAVTLIVEAFKRRLSTVFVGGWKTHVLTALVGIGLAFWTSWPDAQSIAIMSVGLYLFPVSAVGAGKSLLEGVAGILKNPVEPAKTPNNVGLGYVDKKNG